MIMVQSTFQLDPENKGSVIRLMKKMVQLCRQEHGCLSYEYYEGMTDSCQIILLQEWENADCLQDHYQTDHMADFLNKLSKYLESPVTTRSYVSQEAQASASTNPTNEDLPKPEQTIH
ncbi:MAG: putative quinol monooxygenase [Gammaproteobacteria bacterium]|nr:putative quinol monooxygenase [Gammaproteobacteria bacterium]